MKDFAEFLKSLSTEDSPEGDLARDFIISKSKAKTYNGVLNTINKHNPCQGALSALEKVKNRYLCKGI